MKVAIYCWEARGKIVYIGQTIEPVVREDHHRRFGHLRKRLKRIRATFRVLRWTDDKNSARLESQVIVALKRRGEAKYNKRVKCVNPRREGFRVRWIQGNREFASIKECAPVFDVSTATISKILKGKREQLGKRITLEYA